MQFNYDVVLKLLKQRKEVNKGMSNCFFILRGCVGGALNPNSLKIILGQSSKLIFKKCHWSIYKPVNIEKKIKNLSANII